MKQENPDSSDIAVVIHNIAVVYLEMGETDKAIESYEQTLFHEYKALNKERTDVAETLRSLAKLHELDGDLDLALKRYEEAVEYCEKNPKDKTSIQVATLYSYIGNIHIEKGNVDKAMEAYAAALRLNHIVDGDDFQCSAIITYGLALVDVLREHGEAAAAA